MSLAPTPKRVLVGLALVGQDLKKPLAGLGVAM